MVRLLTADEVEFGLMADMDEVPVRGNAIATGDDAADREYENEIITRLKWGDAWAWAQVTVIAKWNGFAGRATLGGCSHRDEKEFRRPGGYFDDLKTEALADLNSVIASHAEKLKPLMP
jgi:hypothetical protein